MTNAIYFSSILLEPNRWAAGIRMPAIRVSDWLARIANAGFDGIELWENHWLLVDATERARLAAGSVPVRIFNSYLLPASAGAAAKVDLAAAIEELRPHLRGMKFNLADLPADEAREIAAGLSLAATLPTGPRLLCECHDDTAAGTPASAGRAFAHWPANRFGAMLHPFDGDDENFSAWLRALGPRLEHLHLRLRGPDGAFRSLSDQPDLVRARLMTLRDVGFHGSMALEFTVGVGSGAENPEALWHSAVADLSFLRGLKI